jgi:hypothetical protein
MSYETVKKAGWAANSGFHSLKRRERERERDEYSKN